MGHEPCALVSDAQHAMELVRTDALLGRTHQMRRHHPLMEWNVGTFINGTDANRILLAAGVAVIPALAHAPAAKGRSLVQRAAVRAYRAIRPTDCLKVLTGCGLVSEDRIEQVGHGYLPYRRIWGVDPVQSSI